VTDELLALALAERRQPQRQRVDLRDWPALAARRELVRAGDAHQEHRGVLRQVDEVLDRIEQDRVGPLEVVDDDDQRSAARTGLQQALNRPERVLRALGLGDDAEHLRHPLGHQLASLLAVDQLGDTRERELRRVGRGDVRRLPDDLDQRPHGDAASELQAVCAQDGGARAQPAHELVHQPRLADATRAEDAGQVAAPLGDDPFEQTPQQLLLELAPDHGRAEAADPAGTLGEDLQQAPGVLRFGEPVDGQPFRRLGRDVVRNQPVGPLTEDDLPGAGGLLESLGEVDGVAGEVLLDRAGLAHQQVTGVDPDPDLELDAPLATKLLGLLRDGRTQLDGRPDRAQGVVLVQLDDAERGHEVVAVPLADAGAAAAENPADGLTIAGENPPRDHRLEPPVQDRRVDHITEQDGDDSELPRRDRSRKPRFAARARLTRLGDLRVASRACRHTDEYMGPLASGKSSTRQITQQPDMLSERLDATIILMRN